MRTIKVKPTPPVKYRNIVTLAKGDDESWTARLAYGDGGTLSTYGFSAFDTLYLMAWELAYCKVTLCTDPDAGEDPYSVRAPNEIWLRCLGAGPNATWRASIADGNGTMSVTANYPDEAIAVLALRAFKTGRKWHGQADGGSRRAPGVPAISGDGGRGEGVAEQHDGDLRPAAAGVPHVLGDEGRQ